MDARENKVKMQRVITVFPSLKDTSETVVEFDTSGKILHKTIISKLNKQHEIDRTEFFYDSNGNLISSIFVHGKMVDSMIVISQSPHYLARTYRDGKLIGWDEKKGDSTNLVESKVRISGDDTNSTVGEWKRDYDASGKLLKKSGLEISNHMGKTDTTFYWATSYIGKSDSEMTFQIFFKKKIVQHVTSQHDSIHHTRTYIYYDENGKLKSSDVEHIDSLNRVVTRNYSSRKKIFSFAENYHYDTKGHFLGSESVSGKRKKQFYQVINTYNSEGLLSEEKRINVKKVDSDVKYEYEYFSR